MGDVIDGKFKRSSDDWPDWVVKALERHAGLSYHRDGGGNFRLEGTSPQLPNGLKVPAELGYMRGFFYAECECALLPGFLFGAADREFAAGLYEHIA